MTAANDSEWAGFMQWLEVSFDWSMACPDGTSSASGPSPEIFPARHRRRDGPDGNLNEIHNPPHLRAGRQESAPLQKEPRRPPASIPPIPAASARWQTQPSFTLSFLGSPVLTSTWRHYTLYLQVNGGAPRARGAASFVQTPPATTSESARPTCQRFTTLLHRRAKQARYANLAPAIRSG